jgi:hypothetical protein
MILVSVLLWSNGHFGPRPDKHMILPGVMGSTVIPKGAFDCEDWYTVLTDTFIHAEYDYAYIGWMRYLIGMEMATEDEIISFEDWYKKLDTKWGECPEEEE